MKTMLSAAAVASITGSILCFAQVADSPSRDELVEAFTKALPDDAVENVESFMTNGFRVESSLAKELDGGLRPTRKEMTLLDVRANGIFGVGIERGRDGMSLGGGIAIFHRDAGTPMLSVGDRDGDGRIDVLTYSVVDAEGESVLDVVDYEADGQPDFRMHFKEGFFEIWHIDRWYRAESREGRRGIVIDGRFTELERRDNRFWVP
jgi:hypothetical protein